MSFSELIGELTELWLLWMRNNAIVRDETLSITERKVAAEECEKLIDKEYVIIEQLDSYFNNE